MFDELWDIIELFPWFITGLYTIEVIVPSKHYWTVRNALIKHVRKYPGEQFVLTLDISKRRTALMPPTVLQAPDHADDYESPADILVRHCGVNPDCVHLRARCAESEIELIHCGGHQNGVYCLDCSMVYGWTSFMACRSFVPRYAMPNCCWRCGCQKIDHALNSVVATAAFASDVKIGSTSEVYVSVRGWPWRKPKCPVTDSAGGTYEMVYSKYGWFSHWQWECLYVCHNPGPSVKVSLSCAS